MYRVNKEQRTVRQSIGIIVEGMDNAGKSTLIGKLRENLLLAGRERKVQVGEGPPRPGESIDDRIQQYLMRDIGEWIFDRHPVISQPIYSGVGGNSQAVNPRLTEVFYSNVDMGRYIIIYCDAMERGMAGHTERPDKAVPGREHIDTPEYLADLQLKYQSRLEMYRQWAARRAHFVYRIGDNENALFASVRARLAWLEHNG